MTWHSDPTRCQAANAVTGEQCFYNAGHPGHNHRSVSDSSEDDAEWIEPLSNMWHIYHLEAQNYREKAEQFWPSSQQTGARYAQMATMYATIELTELLRGNRNS